MIAQSLAERWGSIPNLEPEDFEDLREGISRHADPELTARVELVHRGLGSGEYESAIKALLDWNRLVMSARGGAPWVRLDPDGGLDVRYRSTERRLPRVEDLPTLWRNSYFIDALKALTAQIGPQTSHVAA